MTHETFTTKQQNHTNQFGYSVEITLSQIGVNNSKISPFNQDAFSDWFKHPFDSIIKLKDQDKRWFTSKFPVNESQIIEAWLDKSKIIGLRFGKTTNYGVIDIDVNSPYWNEEKLIKIRHILEYIGINSTVLIQSSFSEGWHLYYFFSEEMPSFKLAQAIAKALSDNGFQIKDGCLEIFPNLKTFKKDGYSLYNGHRLPLQPNSGSCLLDDDLMPYSDSIEVFLRLAEDSALSNDLDLLREAMDEAAEKTKIIINIQFSSNKKESNKAKAWREDLEAQINEGWTGNHQTNDLIKDIVTYGVVFKGLKGDDLEHWAINKIMDMPGYYQYCRHQSNIKQRVRDWMKSIEGYYVPYCGFPERLRGGSETKPKGLTNEEKAADCYRRIFETVEDLLKSNRMPKKISDRRKLISMLARCSERTLIKPSYLKLWHSKHINLALYSSEKTPPQEKTSNPVPVRDTAIRSHPPYEVCRLAMSSMRTFTAEAKKNTNLQKSSIVNISMKTEDTKINSRVVYFCAPQNEKIPSSPYVVRVSAFSEVFPPVKIPLEMLENKSICHNLTEFDDTG